MAAFSAPFSRAAFGPVMLITLGALFAFEYGGGAAFYRTWPVLIIVAGVWKLMDYLGGRQAGDAGQPGGEGHP